VDEYTKQRLEDFNHQLERFVSHIESEQDRVNELSKRLDMVKTSSEYHQTLLTKLDDILRNGGKGLVYRVAGLERDAENSSKNWERWLSVISILLSAGVVIFEIIRK